MNFLSLTKTGEKLQTLINKPQTGKLLIGLLFAFNILLLFQSYRKAYRPIGYDLSSYLLSAEAFLNGANPYQTNTVFPFIYPLFLCVVLVPLSLLPYWLSVFLWFAANLAALFFSVKIFLRLHYGAGLSRQRFLLFFSLSFFMLYEIISNNFLNGQINMLVLFLCIVFLHYYLKQKKGKAGWLLAAAIVIKLTPAILLAYLFFRKDFKSLFLVILQCAVLAVLLPMLFVGSQAFELYDYYFQTFIAARLSPAETEAGTVSFSLMPVMTARFPQLPSLLAFVLSSAIVVVPLACLQLFTPTSKKNRKELYLFSLYLLGMLFLSPMSETHHLIHIYPTLLLIMCCLWQHRQCSLKLSLGSLLAIVLLTNIGKAFHPGFFIVLLIGYIFLFRQLLLSNLKKPSIPAPFQQ